MSRALNEVLNYSNEDVVATNKHWIIFVKTGMGIVLKTFAWLFGYAKASTWINAVADWINNTFEAIPIRIADFILPAIILYLVVSAVIGMVRTFIEYKTVGLTINNIQIKGKSGLFDVGVINANLSHIGAVKVYEKFLGRILGFGSIEFSLNGQTYMMTEMKDVEAFQNAIILFQEAQNEGREMRTSERNAMNTAKIMERQTSAQVEALSNLAAAVSVNGIKSEEPKLLEEIA